MRLILKINKKFREKGVAGVVKSMAKRLANPLQDNRISPFTESLPTDEFLNWIRYAVPGMLWQGNVESMEYAIKHLQDGQAIIEIGSFAGLSATVISYFMDKYHKHAALYTCDKWKFEGQKLGKPLSRSTAVTHDTYRSYVRDTFIRTMQTFFPHRLPQAIECLSDEFFRGWIKNSTVTDVFGRKIKLGGRVGFCYIDGNHSYKFAKHDFENTDRVLAPGGMILFDDSADGSQWEVNRLIREILEGGQYEVMIKNPNYLLRKKVICS